MKYIKPKNLYNRAGEHLMTYYLIPTERRLTFDIVWQADFTRWQGADDGAYFQYEASNGYLVISRSRMDIQTERIWLLGASEESRSGTMPFDNNDKRDAAYKGFEKALKEWASKARWPNRGK